MADEVLPWSPQQEGVGGGSSEGPTLCAFRDRIYAAWKGAGQDDRMFWSSYDGLDGPWTDQREGIGGGSATGPSLAVYQDRLFAAWKGATGDDRMFWSSFDGVSWSPQQLGIGGGSSETPALAAFQDYLFAVWKGAGEDQRIFWSRFDGQQWSAQQQGVGGGTSGRPALATFQGRLYAAWKGAGGDQRMFWSSFDGHSWSPQQVGIGGGTAIGPSLAVYAVGLSPADDRLFAAWRGAEGDERMFWSMFDGHSWSPQQAGVGGGTAVRPALAAFGGKLYAAWKGAGADQRMFWSRITPRRLQFRLRGFSEKESTDDAFQGASDEVYISAIGTDSAAVHFGPDEKLAVDLTEAPMIGDVSDNNVRGPWAQNPHVLLEFDLNRTGFWPRTYVVTLLIVEHDNQDLADTFNEFKGKVGNEVRGAVIAAATSGGAAIGTAVLPGIGTAVGAAAGFLAGLAWDVVIPVIGEGLENEVFKPRVLTLTMPEPRLNGNPPEIDRPQSIRVEEHGAVYDIQYDWHIAEG